MGVELGPERLLDSGRIGRQVAVNRSDNPVFVDSQGRLTCHHGERATSIQEWISKERADPSFKRPSMCDCGNIDGLLTDYGLEKRDGTTALPLYKLLGALGAEQKVINTRPQRKTLTTREGEVWVQPAGTLVCAHGNTRKTLAKIAVGAALKRKAVVLCDCTLKVPRRTGSVFAMPRTQTPEPTALEAEA